MQANEMLEYTNKIIEVFRNGTFLSAHLKKSDGTAYDYALKDVSKCIMKIDSMAKNINLSLFNEFFELSLADYAKYLMKLKNTEENKEFVIETKNRISALKENKKNERKRKKKVQMRP